MDPTPEPGSTELYEIDPSTGERRLVERFPRALGFEDVVALAAAQALAEVDDLVVEDILRAS